MLNRPDAGDLDILGRALRARRATADAAIDRMARPNRVGADRRLVSVYDGGNMPTEGDHFFACHPVQLDGAAAEGNSATTDIDTDTTIYVDFLRSAPSVGDIAVATLIGGRWVAEEEVSQQQPCSATVCVMDCDGDSVVGASVSVTVGTGTVSGTTGSGGCCTITIPGDGNYPATVSATGYYTWAGTLSLDCNETANVDLILNVNTPFTIDIEVDGCCGSAILGATVSIGGVAYTTAVDPSTGGIYVIWSPPWPGTYPVTVSACTFQSYSFTLTVDVCGGSVTSSDCDPSVCLFSGTYINVQLSPESGYICGFNGPYATPPTLHITDPLYGNGTMAYDSGSSTYVGSISGISYAAQSYPVGDCPASSGFTIIYTLYGSYCNPHLQAAYNGVPCGDCEGGFFTWNSASVPQDALATIPCTDGAVSIGCTGNNPGYCNDGFGCGFGNPTNIDSGYVCVVDFDFDFAANPPCPDSECCGTPISPSAPCPCAIWTNFGPGTITVTA